MDGTTTILPKGIWRLVEFDGTVLILCKGQEPYIIRNGKVNKVKDVAELAEEFFKFSFVVAKS